MPNALPPRPRLPGRIALLAACLSSGAASCQALPPPARVESRQGIVRAGSPEEAREVACALDALVPDVLSVLPDSRGRPLEVWVQEEPRLFSFPPSAMYREADGFFSDRLDRIHLRAAADDLRRTLAHELVHASLGPSWRDLPGTIEEGLCDVVAARLCPQSAPRLRAGRLLAAAIELGGFDLELREPSALEPGTIEPEVRYVQHIFAAGDRSDPLDPMDVFRSHAGRSTASIPSDVKKALYGLAFLVTERIVERRGIAGFHALVVQASRREHPDAFAEALLAAADLSRKREDWRRAIAESIGPAEITEISRILPGIAVASTMAIRLPGP